MTLTKFDIDRSKDILNKAKELGMYPGDIPEVEETCVAEAERIVVLAQQAHRVAEEAGKQHVPQHKMVEELLFVAEVEGGAKKLSENGGGEDKASEPQQEPKADEAEGSEVLEGAPSPSSDGPHAGEAWVDDDGVVWVIDEALDNNQYEAHMDGSQEKTVLPRDFFKKVVPGTEQPQAIKIEGKEESSSTPQESPPPSSLPSSEDTSSESGTPISHESTEEPSSQPQSSDVPPMQPAPSSGPSSSSVADSSAAYQDLIAQVAEDFKSFGLPLPKDVANPPDMPDDLTQNETENRRLHSQFNACSGRARFLLEFERQVKNSCKRFVKEAMKPAMRNARAELGTKASVTEVQQQAEDDETVSKWRQLADHHGDREDKLKALFDVYSENVSVLSRDYTMSGREQGGHQ